MNWRLHTRPLLSRWFPAALLVLVAILGSACSSEIAQGEALRQSAAAAPDDAVLDEAETAPPAVGDPATGPVTEGPDMDALLAGCPNRGDTSTAGILTKLVDDLDDAAAHDLANDVQDLARRLRDQDPTGEMLVETMQLVRAADEALEGSAGDPCIDLLEAATGRLSTTSTQPIEAATAPEDQSLTAQLQRGFELSPEDASCVAGQIETNGDSLDTAAVLSAIAACSQGG